MLTVIGTAGVEEAAPWLALVEFIRLRDASAAAPCSRAIIVLRSRRHDLVASAKTFCTAPSVDSGCGCFAADPLPGTKVPPGVCNGIQEHDKMK